MKITVIATRALEATAPIVGLLVAGSTLALAANGGSKPTGNLRSVLPPAPTVGHDERAGRSVGEVVAELAAGYRGQWAWRAFIDSGDSGSDALNQYMRWRAWAFLQCLLLRVTDLGVATSAGARVSLSPNCTQPDDASTGDIIHTRPGGHAAVILERRARDAFLVADAHYNHDDLVDVHVWVPPRWSVIRRYGRSVGI